MGATKLQRTLKDVHEEKKVVTLAPKSKDCQDKKEESKPEDHNGKNAETPVRKKIYELEKLNEQIRQKDMNIKWEYHITNQTTFKAKKWSDRYGSCPTAHDHDCVVLRYTPTFASNRRKNPTPLYVRFTGMKAQSVDGLAPDGGRKGPRKDQWIPEDFVVGLDATKQQKLDVNISNLVQELETMSKKRDLEREKRSQRIRVESNRKEEETRRQAEADRKHKEEE